MSNVRRHQAEPMTKRVVMRANLHERTACLAQGVRPFSPEDGQPLGSLLFEAYLGTVDQEEDTLEQAQAEIDKTISGEYGTFLPKCSMVVERSGVLLSAALLTRFRNRPFVAFSITSPSSKNQGLARACIRSAMAVLLANGEHEIHLMVTLANAPAFHLYETLGFEVERDA
jgi:ribosomal protein S18 acetylase RimI-like enzyme